MLASPLCPRDDESTRLKTARQKRVASDHRLVVFWEGGSASYDLKPTSRLVVGRAEDCDVRVPDDSVSRRHAAVTGGAAPTAEDLGSANGTWVGDRRLEPGDPVPIEPGSVVELGDALLVVRPADAKRERPAPPAAAQRVQKPMDRIDELVALVASSTIPVLVLGETGVGKGVVAEAIHRRSPRAAGPFVRLNCAALAETLLESELFGHERGAFTGAQHAKPGLLEAASGGTILLDEVCDMPASIQAKLLHALEHDEVLRVGALKPRPIDVRFVSATNRDPAALAAEGRFRQDLYFRLNGVTIRIPPLRERPDEVASLASTFVEEASARMGRPAPPITDEAMKRLLAHHWPGNVRELRNAMIRATLFARGSRIGADHFDLAPTSPEPAPDAKLRTEIRALERVRIVEALARCGNNQVEAAKALGISRGTLRSRMKELGLLSR